VRRAHGRLLLVLAMAASALPACAVSGIDFFVDDRVSFVSPSDGAEVELPLELRWRARDFDGRFVVMLDDVRPMRPGESLASLIGSDDPCHRLDTCGSEEWLADHDIYVTDETSLTIERLPDRSGARSDRDVHEVSIVLVDRTGTRVSEALFRREFVIDRGA
jgi:hypothetical protein